ncbi:MAG: CsgG/HfaB family protein [Flavobacteriales bacterium]
MKISLRSYYFILICLVALVGCQGTKHFTKLGAKQEAAGLTQEAAGSYYTALQKKRTNVDAQIGMKKNGQLVLNNLLNDFAKQKNFGTNRTAVDAFHKARNYRDQVQGVGVTLLLADFYEADYNQSKNALLDELYEAGTTLLEAQKYQEAEVKFSEIKALDPNFKDSKDLGDIAYLEPLYSAALTEMELKHYRAAHTNLQKVIQRKIDYKNAVSLSKECLEKGMYTVALLPFENASGTQGLDAKVSAYTLEAMTEIKDPFLKVVDREHMQAIMNEQHLQLSGVIDQNTAVQVGNLVGAQALLTGTVLSYSEKKGTLKSKQRDSYTAYQEKVLNKDDGKYYYQTRYKPSSYTEYYNTNNCTVTFQYKLISLQTGEILKTEIITKEVTDEVLYAKYDGDANSLYPAGQNTPNLNANDKKALMGLISGRQDLRSSTELSNDMFNNITHQMSGQIAQLVQSIVL